MVELQLNLKEIFEHKKRHGGHKRYVEFRDIRGDYVHMEACVGRERDGCLHPGVGSDTRVAGSAFWPFMSVCSQNGVVARLRTQNPVESCIGVVSIERSQGCSRGFIARVKGLGLLYRTSSGRV